MITSEDLVFVRSNSKRALVYKLPTLVHILDPERPTSLCGSLAAAGENEEDDFTRATIGDFLKTGSDGGCQRCATTAILRDYEFIEEQELPDIVWEYEEEAVQKWEYLSLNLNQDLVLSDQNMNLNDFGDAGWELVTLFPLTTPGGIVRYKAVFKRPKKQETQIN